MYILKLNILSKKKIFDSKILLLDAEVSIKIHFFRMVIFFTHYTHLTQKTVDFNNVVLCGLFYLNVSSCIYYVYFSYTITCMHNTFVDA